jgi:hypothetical protein
MTNKPFHPVSVRVHNAMRWNGFWDDAMLNADYDGDGYRRFYEYCVEFEPEHTIEDDWGYKRRVDAGIRWHKFPNFGKKSFAELCQIVGVDAGNLPASQKQIDAKLREVALLFLSNPNYSMTGDPVARTIDALKFALPQSALQAIAKAKGE